MGEIEQTDRNLDLTGRAVWVTGAARGIGRGVCEALWEAGACVAASDVDHIGVNNTARAIRASGGSALPLQLDVTDARQLERAAEQIVEEYGAIDGMVCNAGVISMSPALEIDPGDWERQFDVNVRGLYLSACAAARCMIEAETGGAIVLVASNAGKVGYPNMAAYNASKAAVISLARSLSAEWAHFDINVNAVCPGGVDTPMLGDVADWLAPRLETDARELKAGMKPRQMERHVQPIEVGRVVTFLLSDDARIIRGQAINVDGGDTPY